jgi:hypothetical protein
MNAADGIKKIERTEAFKQLVTPRNILAIVLVTVAAFYLVHCGAERERAKHVTNTGPSLIQRTAELHDTSAARMVHALETKDDAKYARAQHAKTLARVKISGNEVALDGTPLPLPVAQIITTAEVALTTDLVAGAAKDSVIASQDREISLVTDRAETAEAKKAPRLGIKSGIAIGVTGLAALLFGAAKLIRVLK